MRQCRVISSKLCSQIVEDLFRFACAGDDSESPISDLLLAGEPFVGPGKKDGSGQPALHHAVHMPAEHFRLLIFRVANRVHAEFTQDERPVFREILQAQQIAFEISLVVQVNVEAAEIAVLRQKKLRRRIARIREKHIRIGLAADSNQLLDEFRHTPHAQPAHHRAGNLVADEIPEDRWMPAIRGHRLFHHRDDLFPRLPAQELDMFRPGQRDENAHARRRATIQEPERRDVIDPDDVQSRFPHLREVALHLCGRAEVMPFRVRSEGPVGYALNEEFLVAFEKKFCDRANRGRGSKAHSGSLIVQAAR